MFLPFFFPFYFFFLPSTFLFNVFTLLLPILLFLSTFLFHIFALFIFLFFKFFLRVANADPTPPKGGRIFPICKYTHTARAYTHTRAPYILHSSIYVYVWIFAAGSSPRRHEVKEHSSERNQKTTKLTLTASRREQHMRRPLGRPPSLNENLVVLGSVLQPFFVFWTINPQLLLLKIMGRLTLIGPKNCTLLRTKSA